MNLEELTRWGGWIGMALSVITYFAFPFRRKQLDEANAKLVSILEETIKAQDKKIDEMNGRINILQEHQKENIKEIEKIKHENGLLQAVLQGRNEDTTKFYQEGFKAMSTVADTHKLIVGLTESMNSFIISLEKKII